MAPHLRFRLQEGMPIEAPDTLGMDDERAALRLTPTSRSQTVRNAGVRSPRRGFSLGRSCTLEGPPRLRVLLEALLETAHQPSVSGGPLNGPTRSAVIQPP